MKRTTIIGIVIVAVCIGWLTASLGERAPFLVIPAILGAIVVMDYRVGVCFLALALPFSGSPWLPQSPGLNPITYGIGATSAVLLWRKGLSVSNIVRLPKVMFIGMILPLVIGAAIGLPYVGEGFNNFSHQPWRDVFVPTNYLKLFLLKPLYFVFFAFLLANAVKDSKRPERFMWLFALSAIAVVFAIGWSAVETGFSLDELRTKRSFLTELGLHTNSTGKLLAFAFGPMLWVSFGQRGFWRFLWFGATGLVAIGILLTFTRGAYIAMVVVLGIFVWRRRAYGSLLLVTVGVACVLAFGPSAFIERIQLGVDSATFQDMRAGRLDDKLTAGRIGGYQLLIPEISRSPIWGRGTSATAWSEPVRRGLYDSIHPHSMYLAVLLDVGAIGLVLTLYFYSRHLGALKDVSADDKTPPIIREFFAGSAAGLWGVLVYSLANGLWYPEPEWTYVWFSFGVLYPYWGRQREVRERASGRTRGGFSRHRTFIGGA